MESSTNKRSVLIAGGSGGIGSAIAREAAAHGWTVWIGYKSGKDRADSLAREIKGHAVMLPLDQPDAIHAALDAIASETKILDALVLSASPAPVLSSFTKTSASDFIDQWQINVVGTHTLLIEVWKRFFQKAGAGHVVGISSAAAGPHPWPHMSAYVSGKKGMEGLLESAVAELGPAGLSVTVFRANYTDTPMLQAIHAHALEAAKAKMPGGRFGDPKDLAHQVVQALENAPKKGSFATR